MMNRPMGTTVLIAVVATLGLLYIVGGFVALLAAAAQSGAAVAPALPPDAVSPTQTAVPLSALLVGLLGLLVGAIFLGSAWGLWTGRPWAYWLVLLASVLLLVNAVVQFLGGMADLTSYAGALLAAVMIVGVGSRVVRREV